MNLHEKFVITIAREVGSGGRTIANLLANKLNVRFCDKEIIKALRENFNLNTEEIERLKAQKKHWFTDFTNFVNSFDVASEFVNEQNNTPIVATTEAIYKIESELILGLVEEGSCVISGRLGFFVVRNHTNKLNVFITAGQAKRIERIMAKQHVSEEEAVKIIKKVDQSRENYIKRFAQTERYDLRNYDIVLNTDNISDDKGAELILQYINSTNV